MIFKLDKRKLKRIWSIGDVYITIDEIFDLFNDRTLSRVTELYWSTKTEDTILEIQEKTHRVYTKRNGKWAKGACYAKNKAGERALQKTLSYDRLNYSACIDESVQYMYVKVIPLKKN